MWTVEKEVNDSFEIIACGTIETCLKVANRDCITIYETRRGDSSLIQSDYRYTADKIVFRFWENGVNIGVSLLKKWRDYSEHYYVSPDDGTEFKTAITEENVNENYFKLI
ncbi:hypothetical protein [Escherichia phage FL38]